MTKAYTADEKKLIELYRKGKIPLASFITSHLFNGLTEDDLWKELPHGIEIDGVLYKRNDLQVFANEADNFLNSKLWNQTKKVLQVSANKKMFYSGITENDLLFGRAMLYNINVFESFLKKISKLV